MHRILGFLLAFTLTAAAAEPLVTACAAMAPTAHRCCTGERIGPRSEGPSNCCITRAPDNTGTPATARADILSPPAGLPTVADVREVADAFTATRATLRSPPRAPVVDLPTLFSALLI